MDRVPVLPASPRDRPFRRALPAGLSGALLPLVPGLLAAAGTLPGGALGPGDLDRVLLWAGLGLAAGLLAGGAVSDRLGPRWTFVVASLGAALALAGLGLLLPSAPGAGAPRPSTAWRIPALLTGTAMALGGASWAAAFRAAAAGVAPGRHGRLAAFLGTCLALGLASALSLPGLAALDAVPESLAALPAGWRAAIGALPWLLLAAGGALLPAGRPLPVAPAVPCPRTARVATGLVAFCAAALATAIVQWFPVYTRDILPLPPGHLLRAGVPFAVALAGIAGAGLAGLGVERLAGGRRARWATALCLLAVLGAVAMVPGMQKRPPVVGWVDASRVPLKVGDRILDVDNPRPDLDHGRDPGWTFNRVLNAIRCVPSRCQGEGVRWDLRKCLCTRDPDDPAAAPIAGDNRITFTIEREGQVTDVAMDDPLAFAGAEDRRLLPMGPPEDALLWATAAGAMLVLLGAFGTLVLAAFATAAERGGTARAGTSAGVVAACAALGAVAQSLGMADLTARDWTFWPLSLVAVAVGAALLARHLRGPSWPTKGPRHRSPTDPCPHAARRDGARPPVAPTPRP
jgi:MFS family permease